ncbi:UDP-glucose dehydrogenase [Dissulfuribacter thermophilus]|uniref:UDP-glucose 6-dehydrogenase n=1 Tax=Dissulfuribacter thermophilus TaxID=1156395 RepID=A0A1B9F7S4_9BACT|nr:UDP-glucose/GDP-mannose dehydrogenase family protein [Dissulfuribacter thermophilus]OCC15933.1 UDP-glucose dehydrogenase [Dissulfuribacter thermophilus]
MHVTVIGTGYVGLVAGAGLADFGLQVICVDKIKEKIDLLKNGEIPFYEPGLKELVERNISNGRLSFSTDLASSVRLSLVIFIAVGTPSKDDGTVDLSAVEAVAREIGKTIDDYKVVVTKSTVPVGTNRRIKEIIEKEAQNGITVDVVSNPEFLREGSAVEDFMRPNRVVLGSDSEKALAIVKDIYRPLYLIETPFVITNLETAEMIKYASNAFLATKISFINEVANLCEAVGADVHHVAKAMGLDKRIGPKFLHPGPGFGGSCFPKDTKAFAAIGQEFGSPVKIVEAVIEVNENQKRRSINKVKEMLKDQVAGSTIAVLGLSFKPNTSDIREAPAITLVDALLKEGAKVKAYDPAAQEEFKRLFAEDKVHYAKDPYEAAEGADIVVVVTEWNEFRNLDLIRLKDIMNQTKIVDLRNVYDPKKVKALGFDYVGIGRG